MPTEEETYLFLCKAHSPSSSHLEGIVVACDLGQEWLLSWWWERYKRFNSFPVTFIDLGMSHEMKAWCKERGHYIHLPIFGTFVSEKSSIDKDKATSWEQSIGKEFWSSRAAWFRKPLACLQSPYLYSIWIDLDCEVKGSLRDLFSFCSTGSEVSVSQEVWDDGKMGINSGVIAFKQGSEIICRWALESYKKHTECKGDQEVLHEVIQTLPQKAGILPSIYNWSRLEKERSDAIIVHWHGPQGKAVISHQILKENNPFL